MRINGSCSVIVAAALACQGQAAEFLVTNRNDSGAGSLRQAVLDAGAAAGADTISFASGLTGTITLGAEIAINHAVTIDGPGSGILAVSGNDVSRIFSISSGAVVEIDDLTLRNGRAPSGASSQGGAIEGSSAVLTLRRCILRDSAAIATTAASGGAIKSTFGSLTLEDCSVINNRCQANTSSSGGGVDVFEASLIVRRCFFSGNIVQAGTSAQGGGLNLLDGPVCDISSSTFTANSVTANFRAGSALGLRTGGVATLESCTVWGNTSTQAIDCLDIVVNARNNLLGQNSGGSVRELLGGQFVSLGNNIDNDGTAGLLPGVNNDLVGSLGNPVVDVAHVSPPDDNGGFTPTMALSPACQAIDAGAVVAGNDFDGRGLPRSADGDCDSVGAPDIGAFEFSSGVGLVLTAPGDYLKAPPVDALAASPLFTFEAWITPRAVVGESRILSNTGPAGLGLGFGLRDGRLLLSAFGISEWHAVHAPLTPGEPVHVAVAFRPGKIPCFYVNGALVDVRPPGPAYIYLPDPMGIGRDLAGTPDAFDGRIAQVRIWKYDRSDAQIAALYNQMMTSPEGGMIALWPMLDLDTQAVEYVQGLNAVMTGTPYQFSRECAFICEGDLNGDGLTDLDDLLVVLGNFGTASRAGDSDFDGDTDLDDLLIVLGEFGAVCS